MDVHRGRLAADHLREDGDDLTDKSAQGVCEQNLRFVAQRIHRPEGPTMFGNRHKEFIDSNYFSQLTMIVQGSWWRRL